MSMAMKAYEANLTKQSMPSKIQTCAFANSGAKSAPRICDCVLNRINNERFNAWSKLHFAD